MKKSIQFSTNMKIDLKEKFDLYMDKNVKKIKSNQNFDNSKPKYHLNNNKETKTINLKKGLLINEQPKVNNIFINNNNNEDYKVVLKMGSKSKNQNELIIPGKIRIVNGNIYSYSTEKNF